MDSLLAAIQCPPLPAPATTPEPGWAALHDDGFLFGVCAAAFDDPDYNPVPTCPLAEAR